MLTLISFAVFYYKGFLGKNVYGTCSTKEKEHTGYAQIFGNLVYILICIYALVLIKK